MACLDTLELLSLFFLEAVDLLVELLFKLTKLILFLFELGLESFEVFALFLLELLSLVVMDRYVWILRGHTRIDDAVLGR